jgi:hypothetical protein
MSNFPKISVEKSLLVGPTDPAHKIPGPSPDLPGIAGINGPLIIGGKFDGYVADRYTNAMICVVPPSEEVFEQIGISTFVGISTIPETEVKVNPLSISGELFGPLADAITISKQGNPLFGPAYRYDGVGIRVNANAHLIEYGEILLCTGPLAFFTGEVVSNEGAHTLSKKKNFDIPHPTKEGWRLTHSCVEGPEAAVYIRGRVTNRTEIELPLYWKDLVDIQSITVNLTSIGVHQDVIIKRWDEKKIYLQANGGMPIDCFYYIMAERKDTEKLIPEYQGTIEDYPGDNSQRSIAGYHYDVKENN